MSNNVKSEIMAINRFRMGTDGRGISTLVVWLPYELQILYKPAMQK